MEPGHFVVRSWIDQSTNPNLLHDRLTIYDAGDRQGFLLKFATGKTVWIVFQICYRLNQEDGTVLEGCEVLEETKTPLHYFSIETYPMQLQQQGKLQMLLTLPQAQILMSLSETPVFSPPAEPQQLPLQPQQPPPSLSQSQSPAGPVSRALPKSSSSKPTGGQRSSQNKNTSLPTSRASPSSNRGGHGQRLSQAPLKQARHRLPSPPTHHTGHVSSESPPWTSLAQQSLYSRPPPEVAKEYVGQA